jgi:hypothetical protein
MAKTQPTGATPTTPNAFDVIITMTIANACDRDTLEDLAIIVLEAVQEHADEVALGPVVSAKFDPRSIELDFDVMAHSVSEVHQKMALVSEVVEKHTPLSILIATSETWPSDHKAPARRRRDLVAA